MNILLALDSFWPSTAQGWITLVGALLVPLGSIVGMIVAIVKLVKNKNWDKLKEVAKAAAVQAEASGKSGEDKLSIVMDAVQAAAKELGVRMTDEAVKTMKDFISGLITWHNDLDDADAEAKSAK